METDLGKIVLCHREHERGVGHEYVAVFAVECHELVFAFLEGCECLGVVAFDPAGFVHRHGFPAALCTV